MLRMQIMSDAHGGPRSHSIDREESRVFHEVIKLLHDLPDDMCRRIFPEEFQVVPREWEDPGLDSGQAHALSVRLRSEAFALESMGEVPVLLVTPDEEQSGQLPDIVITLCAMLEHMAARLGPGQRVCFNPEAES